MNLWHDISPGENTPEEVVSIVEVYKGSNNKYEIDKDTGLIALDRANYSSSPYPVDYGFIPQSYWYDGDAFDVIILSTFPVAIGTLVEVRPVALMKMTDDGDDDSKIIGVPKKDRRFEDIQDLPDLNKHTLKEIRHFFQNYKVLKKDSEESGVTVDGFEDKQAALEAVQTSLELYKEKIKNK